ncbi:hypothetical protein AWH60_01835 [Pseudoalteromonas haloplanktis]|uniref:hypothetical protein n=1 Tax=Pseudoalteromonas sp. meg-B1 TaxID=2203192 RepID=UPI000948DBE7|nr:hypothetical protein [Pseudoalteromonas sp. meg-B1]OLF80145.1 hypothetical protein AWH60_01835 [Pseudoalteromonas haloplanktis]PWS56344.1 hypothetical protein DK924_06290 [Pseudoalteromonas sp. meg-B1]
MKGIRRFWFWFTLVVCPLLIILGVATFAQLLGQYMYSQQFSFSSLSSFQIAFIGGGVCAFSVFLSTLKEAKIRFFAK